MPTCLLPFSAAQFLWDRNLSITIQWNAVPWLNESLKMKGTTAQWSMPMNCHSWHCSPCEVVTQACDQVESSCCSFLRRTASMQRHWLKEGAGRG